MKSKFSYLVKYSLKKKINTKWFKVVNVLLCILLIGLINLESIINFFGGDFKDIDKIYVVDNINGYESFKNYFEVFAETLEYEDYEITLDNSILDRKDELDEEIILVLNNNAENYISGEIISNEAVSRITYEIVTSTMNTLKSEVVLSTTGMSAEEINKLTSPVNITETILDKDAKDYKTQDSLIGFVTAIIIVPFFLLIVTMVQMLGAEINDEKSSRSMEIIISSVPAKTHFASKILASLAYVLFQGLLLFIYVAIGLLIHKLVGSSGDIGIFSELISSLKDANVFSLLSKGAIPLIILLCASFLLYAIVSATLASMTTNIEDFQQLQTPLMLIMMVAYYVALMSAAFDGAIFIKVLGYVPMLSALIAPTLYFLGDMSLISLIGSSIVIVIVTYIVYIYGLRIYKVGILNYSSSKLWKKMFKSLKEKN